MKLTAIGRMDWSHTNAGGAEKYLKEVLYRLADDYDIRLYCSKGTSLPNREIENGIEIVRCGINTDSDPYINQTAIALRYYRDRRENDVLLVNGASQLYPLFRSSKRVDIHHLFGGYDSIGQGVRMTVKFGLEWVAMRLPKGRQIAVSQNQKEKIERETSQSIDQVVNGGVDLETFSCGIEKADHPMILHIGRIGKQKGTDYAIDIHQRLEQRLQKGIKFHICGSGQMDELVEEYASGSETATYHGYVSEERKVELMQRAWLTLMPSRAEAFPLVVMEANAAGCPVIGSSISGLSDSIKNGVNGYRGDVEEMTDRCVQIISNTDERTGLWDSTLQHSRQYSWDKTADGIRTACERVTGR